MTTTELAVVTQELAVVTHPITVPEEIIQIRATWVKSKEIELERARSALQQLRESDASERRIQRVTERVSLLRKVVRVLQAGYLPIPRFQGDLLRLDMEELPLKAIVAVNEAAAQKLFDEFRLVQGVGATSKRGTARINQRDPLIVGVARTKTLRPDPERSWIQWSQEEHFLIAWWRPEDERQEEMY